MHPARVALVLAVVLAACGGSSARRRAAARDHGCPEERIAVVAHDPNVDARSVQLDVCGHRRVYRDIGGVDSEVWVDSTPPELARLEEMPPDVPRESPTERSSRSATAADVVRARLDARRAPILACLGTEAAALDVAWTAPTTIEITPRGVTDPALVECVRVAVGPLELPAGTTGTRLVHPVSR